jgi:hypothetical protein
MLGDTVKPSGVITTEGLARLRVQLQGGDVPANFAKVLKIAWESGAFASKDYQLQQSDTICKVYTAQFSLPPRWNCTEDLESVAMSTIAGLDSQAARKLIPGQNIRIPAGGIDIHERPISVYVDESQRSDAKAQVIGPNKRWIQSVKPFRGITRIDILGYDVTITSSNVKALQNVETAVSLLDDRRVTADRVWMSEPPLHQAEPPQISAEEVIKMCRSGPLLTSARGGVLPICRSGDGPRHTPALSITLPGPGLPADTPY